MGTDWEQLPEELRWGVLVSDYRSKLHALWMFREAAEAHLEQLSQYDWYDERLSRFENKLRMKELGGALFGIRKYLRELTIIGLAKTMEDFFGFVKETADQTFRIWDHDDLGLLFHREARYVWALNNVIKHNNSVVGDSASSKNAAYLVNAMGLSEGDQIELLPLDERRLFFQIHGFLDDFTTVVAGIDRVDPARYETEEAFSEFAEDMTPGFLRRPAR